LYLKLQLWFSVVLQLTTACSGIKVVIERFCKVYCF